MGLQLERLTVTDLAKHFWSVQAAEYIKDKEVDIKALDEYGDVISEAESWIYATLGRGTLYPDPSKRSESIILAYPTARMLITILGNEFLLRRFANSVSKYAGIMLEKEDEKKIVTLATTPGNLGERPWDLIYEKATPSRKITIGERIFEWRLLFTDYISVAQSFHDIYWKLVNKAVTGGWVYLLKADVTRLMEEALKIRIGRAGLRPSRELPSVEDLPPNIRKTIERVSGKVKQRISEFQQYDMEGLGAGESAYPGCMKKILDKLEKGLGVSHSERLALVFFLSNTGKNVDEILQAFSKAPDFDAQRSRYYVEHAMGLRGGGTKYKPYGCPKLKTYGICNPQDDWCKNGRSEFGFLKGPVDFYKAKSRLLSKGRKEKSSS